MVKKIIILTLWVNISFAISSLELAKNLVNNPSKNSQLELLFSNNSKSFSPKINGKIIPFKALISLFSLYF